MHKQPEVTAATRKKLMDAFWAQYISTPIEKITISTITKSAGVHRSTFYEYFKDIYDLLEQLEDDLLEQLKSKFIPLAQINISRLKDASPSATATMPPDLGNFIHTTLSFFTEYGDLLYYLSGPSGDPAFRKKLYHLFKPTFMTMHAIPENSPYADYLSSFVFAVILNNLEYWFEHKDSITMQEVVVLTYKLMGNGLTNHFFYGAIPGI